jgi:hypothetical protein
MSEQGPSAERWTFGEEPLDQTVELAGVLRDLIAAALALEAPAPGLAHLLGHLRVATDELAAEVPPGVGPRVGDAVDGDGRVYLDHAYDVGRYNPAFPVYDIAVEGDHAHGTVEFPIVYEGPPGLVHGGFIGVLFDCVIQHHNCELNLAGKTTDLDVRYRRPTPVATPLTFEIDRRLEDERIVSDARLLRDGKVCAEAQMRAVAGNRANLPAVSLRRPPT